MDGDLGVLQGRCRKDPESYRAEYTAQQQHFISLVQAASLRPSDASPRLADSAAFVASTAALYGAECCAAVAGPAVALLHESAGALHPAARRALVRTLALLRARGGADPAVVLPLFFRLLGCEDKVLRRMLHGHIMADVRRMQASGDGGRRALQGFLFGMVGEPNHVLVKRSIGVLVDLFRKRTWHDARTANVVASCVFHESTAVALIAAKFLLDSESKDEGDDEDGFEEDSEEEEEGKYSRGHDGRKASDMWKAYNLTGKKSSKKRKAMERTIKRATRVKRGGETAGAAGLTQHASFAAMMLLNDPQSFAERLYADLQTRRKNEPYENRLMLVNLLSRLVGTHKLLVLNLYPFLQRYLQPAQPEVTRVLAYLAQACHELVPPDVLHPVVRGLADNFVSERCSPPAMAAGLNTIRAICARVPLAIFDQENEDKPEDEQEAPLLEDLVQYKSNRDKGVVMAARSLIALYRDVNPRLLHKRDRGRSAAEAVQKGTAAPAPAYGRVDFVTGVAGAELLDRSDTEEEDDEMEADVEDDEEDGDEAPELVEVDENEEAEESSSKAGSAAEGDETATESLLLLEEKDDDGDNSGKDDDGDDDDEEESASKGGEEDGVSAVGDDGDTSTQGGTGERADRLRILTDDDYKRIRARSAAHAVQGTSQNRVMMLDTGEAVDPKDIQGILKRERRTLEERMETVLAGREGREKFGSRKGMNKGGGSTNKAKLKTKSNSMVIHKKRQKSKMSRVERQQKRTKKRAHKK